MATKAGTLDARARARRWFWLLVVTSVVLMGVLFRTASSEPGPLVAVMFFVVAVFTVALILQAVRIWLALETPRTRLGGWRGVRQELASRRAARR